MTDQIDTKTELLEAMDHEWERLYRLIMDTGPDVLVEKRDSAGWSAKDHLAHLAVWENSVLTMLRDGTPRWEGLGIDRAIYSLEDFDPENEVIRRNTAGMPLEEVVAFLKNTQDEMRRHVDGMTDEALLRPLSDFAEGGQGETVMRRLLGTFPWHQAEHRAYIERILAG